MPVMPQDTSAENLSDAVQSKPKDSNEKIQESAFQQKHSGGPGPVLTGLDKLGEPASKEELRKRAAELNKDS